MPRSATPRPAGSDAAMPLSQYAARIGMAINSAPELSQQWVTAETLDVRVSGPHCYLELIEKDPSGRTRAKARATIWGATYARLNRKFAAATGAPLQSGIKIMALVSAAYHPEFGLSLNITDIDPSFTLGDIARLRRQILDQLTADGIIDLNRQLPWPLAPQRIAIISAPGAAGYGDFIKRVYTNPYRLRFATRLFPAVMQGERAAASVIDALGEIYAEAEQWDCVVIIRGGGSTADLAAFDNYELAANIAQFDLPVISGIGHDRDYTVVDFVASRRAETPTAAADFLVSLGAAQLGRLQATASALLQSVTDRLSLHHQRLSAAEAALPAAAERMVADRSAALARCSATLESVVTSRITQQRARLDTVTARLSDALQFAITARRQALDSAAALAAALGPEATLARGFTITELPSGAVVTSAADLAPGMKITTRFADGAVASVVECQSSPISNNP